MRNTIRFAAGAAAILLAVAPAAAQRPGPVASSGRPTGYNGSAAGGRAGFVRGRPCLGQTRRCFADRSGRGRGFGLFAYGYGGLTEDPESLRDQGFFADTGNSWRENGRAVYDYDRGYPYDWYRDPGAAADAAPRSGPPMVRCEVSWVAGARGEPSPVRVCRGSR